MSLLFLHFVEAFKDIVLCYYLCAKRDVAKRDVAKWDTQHNVFVGRRKCKDFMMYHFGG
jgi:hypothetical protein